MKMIFGAGVMAAVVLLAGCGQKNNAADVPAGPAKSATATVATNQVATNGPPATMTVPTPVMQPILTVWQEGNRAAAINQFSGANWNARPLFPAAMAVGLTEAQFKGLSGSERDLRNNEMLAQLDLVKQIVTAVNESGQEALAKGDTTRAQKIFTALKQCGAALDEPAAQLLVKQVGQVCEGMGGRGLAKLVQ
jgi:hypothetical protein